MEEAILKRAEAKRKESLDFLTGLVSTDTSNEDMGAYGRELNGQKIIIGKLEEMGAELDIFEPDYGRIKKYREASPGHDYKDRPNVVGVFRGAGGGRSLIINGHIDTVPCGSPEEWISHPLQPVVRDGRLYGRGTCDMKGGLAAAVMALEAVRDSGVKLKGDVILQSVVDEEGGGNGTLACCERGYTADAAIIPEPTQLQLMPAHMGWLFYKIEFRGRALHCAYKWKGVNAIEKCMKLMQAMQELERTWAVEKRHPYLPPPTISFGTIHGGTSGSVVPDKCTLDMSVHYLPCKVDGEWMGEKVEKEFLHVVENVANSDDWLRENPPVVTLYQLGSGYDIGTGHPIIECVRRNAAKVKGGPPFLRGLESGADARLLTNYADTPTLIFGPGNIENAHSINEFIDLEQYYEAIKILALAIVDWCGSVPGEGKEGET